MYIITSTKKSFSTKEIQRQLGHKRYEPIWAMVHKLPSVMGFKDDQYQFKYEIELDEGFFETVSITRDASSGSLKRERGNWHQATVLLSVESKDLGCKHNSQKHDKYKQVGYLKSLKKETIKAAINTSVKANTKIVSDKSTSYVGLDKDFEVESKVIPKKDLRKVLSWAHTIISNAKRLLLEIQHRKDDDFLKNYLDEFCYKFNRRYMDNLFDRLMVVTVSYRMNFLENHTNKHIII